MSRLNRTLGLLLWCALVVGLVALAFGERRVDFWWQLGQGNPVTESDSVPAFGLPHRPFVNEYQLYELSLFVFDRIAGLGAIHAAFVATFLLIFAIPLAAARGIRRDGLSLLLVALAAIFLINRHEERPEFAAVLLLTVLVFLLTRARRFSLSFLAAVILLFAIWTNVHSSYLVGLLALGIWLLDRLLLAPAAERWKPAHAGLALACAGGAVLLNPYGYERIVFTFAQENDLGSTILSREMWPAWDQPPGLRALMAVALVVLVLVFARRPRHSAWLLALAAALFVLTLLHIRHMSFLAVALLFLYADRRADEPATRPLLPTALVLGAGCLVVLLFDVVALRNALGDVTASEDAHNRGFAPGLLQDFPRAAILCHDAEGSYIEGHYPGRFPLLDSGQMHFDDETKRFYFFAVQDAHGFDLALQSLPTVDAVVVTPPVEGWTLALLDRPGWHLAGAEACGLLFRRGEDAASPPDLGAYRDEALREGDCVRAFCFSAMTSPPRDSLRLLDQSRVSAWSEAFFSFARAWIQRIPASELQAFEQAQPKTANGLLRELIFTRLHPDDPLPPPGASTLEQLARVLTLLDRHDEADARALFATVRRPYVSVLYYTLRSRLDPSFLTRESSFERWQDWNAGGLELFQRMTPQLNQRAGDLVRATGNS